MDHHAMNTALLRRNGFTFKHFFIAHDRCEMKVSTDGILLGAWAPLHKQTQRILDIGTGSGLLALMLAQRAEGQIWIDAVELDEKAAQQAKENFAASPWAANLRVHCQAIQNFCVDEERKRYDLIISNPPYYLPGVACRSPGRDNARYTTMLDHATLLRCVSRLSADEGTFSLILPIAIGETFTALALQHGWFLHRATQVADSSTKKPRRILMAFVRQIMAGKSCEERLDIRQENHEYSTAYRALTRDFYLAF